MLDIAVARAVMLARQIERALHDSGPWSIRVDGITYPAVRWITENQVQFRVHMPDVCWLDDDTERMVDLLCSGEVVGTRTVEFIDGESTLDWIFALSSMAPSQA